MFSCLSSDIPDHGPGDELGIPKTTDSTRCPRPAVVRTSPSPGGTASASACSQTTMRDRFLSPTQRRPLFPSASLRLDLILELAPQRRRHLFVGLDVHLVAATCNKVHLLGVAKLGLVDDFVPHQQDEEEGHRKICRDERRGVERRHWRVREPKEVGPSFHSLKVVKPQKMMTMRQTVNASASQRNRSSVEGTDSQYERYGCAAPRKANEPRSIPCALVPRRKRM